MSEKMFKALLSAAASSAMEGMPLDEDKLNVAEKIISGEITLQDYFESIQLMYQEN